MARLTEAALRAELKSAGLRRVYFLYGEENFLVKTYTDRIISAAVPEDQRDMNFIKYTKLPKPDELSDYLENVPFLSEYKCVLIEDLDADAMAIADHKAYLAIIGNVPDSSVLIISQKNVFVDPKKPKDKMKKLIAACDAAGACCELNRLPSSKLAEMAQGKFLKAGCSISHEDAVFLVEECGGSLTVMQTEIEKLCSYKGSGTVTRGDIEKLVPRRIDSNIYNLSKELFAGRTGSALHILDDLFVQRTKPFMISAALSGYFTDLYRAKLAMQARKSSADAAKAFGYYGRAFVMDNAFRSARPLSAEYLGSCIDILYRTNRLINSSEADDRILLERAITEIAALNKK